MRTTSYWCDYFKHQNIIFQLNLLHIKDNSKQKRLNSRKKIMLKTKATYMLLPGEKCLEPFPSEESDAEEQVGLVEPTV